MRTNKYKAKLSGFKATPSANIPKMHEDLELIKDSNELLSDLFNVILKQNQYYGIRWLMGLERYVLDQSKKIPRIFRKNLSRGHIVEVELFGHFNKELTFLHPAVVLFDNNKGQLLVAPITSGKHGDSDPLHIDVDSSDGLHHESGICLEAIRGVDKNRVLYQHSKDGKNAKVRSEVLDRIDLAVMEHFMPNMFKKFKDAEIKLIEEQQKNKELMDEIETLKEQLKQSAYQTAAATLEE
ncbi:type II toxin-antitoxin system PemK/MazF family toxin [Metabacillus litoralis]|uniref:type II toxin-antitoxin system PemK/MazF family toxin n=1 Tax=Metabacillus TaxID=2675233 RepID=UPI00203AFB77|nr:type II toxin-antitoxin system PemK/MazF family toxin [Metabacillus litoralis]MCM3164528.1 type II toxin-antitoxin system PemK/MazF family toxin [Metabacillus litoralis]